MSEELWESVDAYIGRLFVPADPALQEALRDSAEAGLPEIQVTPNLGKFLHLLARVRGARRILEIGTLGGYSTIWLARALPAEGRLITLESVPSHVAVARRNLARAGLRSAVEVREGPAMETLPQLAAENAGPFDFIFIDANKDGYPEYFEWALRLSAAGTLIVADNVIRKGAVNDPASTDPLVQGVRRFNERVAAEPRVTATEIQTVGAKGYDGFALILVTG